uniref:Uncharacterized protein n=1 Tax=viral metagenome TaxID=1070528 RepID=A0A6C0CQ92_9ZZZZ
MNNLTAASKPLTKEQKIAFDKGRANYFKGSITAMVIYGTIILIFGLIGIFSESGRYFLFQQNFGFTVTFMGGVILVITLLLIQLLTYKPIKKEYNNYDNLICPDYWELKKVTPEMKKLINKKWQPWTNYYCQAPPNIKNISTDTLFSSTNVTPLDKNYTNLLVDFNRIDGLTANNIVNNSVAMTCGRMYPEYMNKRDIEADPDKPNSLRCRYIKDCSVNNNVTWTDVCPSPN